MLILEEMNKVILVFSQKIIKLIITVLKQQKKDDFFTSVNYFDKNKLLNQTLQNLQ